MNLNNFNKLLARGIFVVVAVVGIVGVVTLYQNTKYRSSRNLAAVDSSLATTTTIIPNPSGQPACVTSGFDAKGTGTNWQNLPFSNQTGVFTADFDATPSGSNMDGVVGISNGAGNVPGDFAILIRFNKSGVIDARNGSNYTAVNSVSYSSGQTYHVRIVTDPQAHTYNAYVKTGAGNEVQIANNYAFRSEQATVSQLNNRGLLSFDGVNTINLCNFTISVVTVVSTTPTPTPTPTPTGPITTIIPNPAGQPACVTSGFDAKANTTNWKNLSFVNQTGVFTADFDVTPSANNTDSVIGISNGAGNVPNDFAILLRFNNKGTIDARTGSNYSTLSTFSYIGGQAYHFRVVIDPQAHTYSAFVKSAGGTEVQIAQNYAYRSGQTSTSQFNNRGLLSFDGRTTIQLCNFTISVTTTATSAPTPAPAPVNVGPVANAGADKSITLPTNSTTFSGSGTDADGTISAYSWTQVSGASIATLSGTSGATLTASNLVQGSYTFQLTVTDNGGLTASDSVILTVNPAPNVAPSANAGADKSITLPTNSTTITGSATDSDGSISAYAWAQTSGPSTATLSGASTASLTASSLVTGTYTFRLTVTDNSGATANDSVNVVVNPAPNVAPVVNAGADTSITLPTNSVTLTGTATDSTGTIASYAWTQVSGPSTATLAGATGLTLTASNLVQGTYSFQLKATDSGGLSSTDTVNVVVNAAVVVTPPPTTPSAGWTTLNQASDAKLVYVSSSSGSDTNPGTQAAPVRTIAQATRLVRNGYPDWILLKSGDVFNEAIDWRLSGRSASYPIVLTSYGTGARPSVRPPSGQNGFDVTTGTAMHDIAIVGIEFYAVTRDPSTPGYSAAGSTGIWWYGPGSNLLVEDCAIRFFNNNLVIQSPGGASAFNNFSLKRSVVTDAYALSSVAHGQGIYISLVNGITITENVFDHNGWNEAISGAERVIFNHNIYIDNENLSSNNIVSGNILARGSSHGLQLRAGGVASENFFVGNAISLLIGGGDGFQTASPNGVPATASNNVIMYGNDIDSANPRGWGFDLVNIAGGTVSNNIVAHDKSVQSYGHGISIDDPTRSLSFVSNIVYDWHTPLSQNTTGVSASGNQYTNFGGTNTYGYPDPNRDAATYNASLGGVASLDAFLARARQQSKANWNPAYTASAINTYIRAGFGR